MFYKIATVFILCTIVVYAFEYDVVAHHRRLIKYDTKRIRRDNAHWNGNIVNVENRQRFWPGQGTYLDIYIYAPAKHTTKLAGESVHFDCELTQGYSATWSRENGARFSQFTETKKLKDRNIYRIDIENLDESDSGKYVCAANSDNPTDKEFVYLEVHGSRSRDMTGQNYDENQRLPFGFDDERSNEIAKNKEIEDTQMRYEQQRQKQLEIEEHQRREQGQREEQQRQEQQRQEQQRQEQQRQEQQRQEQQNQEQQRQEQQEQQRQDQAQREQHQSGMVEQNENWPSSGNTEESAYWKNQYEQRQQYEVDITQTEANEEASDFSYQPDEDQQDNKNEREDYDNQDDSINDQISTELNDIEPDHPYHQQSSERNEELVDDNQTEDIANDENIPDGENIDIPGESYTDYVYDYIMDE